MASDIFLSYCRADQQFADSFIKAATARGLTVWYDRMIEGGQDWREKIVDALGSSKALVILFSDHSNASSQLIKELAIADNLRKLVVPVLIAKCEPQGAYLYELASRNWVNLHPDPEIKLPGLMDDLLKELDLRDGRSRAPSVGTTQESNARPTAGAQDRTAAVGPVARPPTDTVAAGQDESWFPLGRYDLYVVVPILVIAFLMGIFGEGDTTNAALGLSIIASFCYMIVIAVRNARLNRSIFSGKSFASSFVVLAIGSLPALLTEGNDESNVLGFVGLLIIALLIALVANALQAVLRKIFQQNIFRTKIV